MIQRTLFGKIAKEKTQKYIVYKIPKGNYECFIERHCLREKCRLKSSFTKQKAVQDAQTEWQKVKKDPEAIQAFLKLLPGEQPFVIYDEDGFEVNRTVRESSSPLGYFRSSTDEAPKLSAENDSSPSASSTSRSTSLTSSSSSTSSTSSYSSATFSNKDTIPDASNVLAENTISMQPYWKETFVVFCQKMECETLATDDVINNESFVKGIYNPSKAITNFIDKLSEYNSRKKRCNPGTSLSKLISKINMDLTGVKSAMKDASEVIAPANRGLDSMISSMQVKAGMLQRVLVQTLELQIQIKDTHVIDKMQKRITQVAGKPHAVLNNAINTDLNLLCLNSHQSWSEAYVAMENTSPGWAMIASSEQLRAIATYIQQEFCVEVSQLGVSDDVVRLLMMNFPIMKAKEGNKEVLIDACELLLQKDCFLRLLCLDTNEQDETKERSCEEPSQEEPEMEPDYGPHVRRGRTPLYVKFPSLIECATAFIKQHSFAAHARRRETTATGNGVSLGEIREHLNKNVPGLQEAGGISRDAVHRLMIAPRKNSLQACRYKGVIDARIPGKRNQYREDNANQHFLFARASYREELLSQFSDESQFYSADDMNKLRMGPATAVSRYHQIARFFSTGDAPNLADHDFPNPEYLLCPSGYMSLSSQQIEIDEAYIADELNDMTPDNTNGEAPDALLGDENFNGEKENGKICDKLGRLHYQKLKAGPSFIKLRACKFDPSSSMCHANDLLPILRAQVTDGKTCAFVKVDNGGDWNLHSLVNAYYMHRLWKDSGLDILGIISYAASWSAYNNIEHLWSPVSRSLCSVILPSILDGDDKAPCKMTDIDAEERRQKEAILFDNAMDVVVSNYWNNLTFNGNAVTTSFKHCLANEEPYNDYQTVHKLLSGGLNAVRNNVEVMKELRHMFAHMERKSNELIFRKCVDTRCSYCPAQPVKCVKLWNYLKERDFKWANPLPSTDYPGHYMTFLEVCKVDNGSLKVGNDGLPNSLAVGYCPYCANLLFMSNAEKEKHLKILHHHLKGDNNKVWKTEHRCLFVVKGKDGSKRCNLLFDNKTKLKEHRLKEKHTTVKRKKVEKNAPAKEPKQLRLDSMLGKTSKNVTEKNVNSESSEITDVNERDDLGATDDNEMATETNVNMEVAYGEEHDGTTSKEKSIDEENDGSESDGTTNVTVSLGEYVVAVYVDDLRPYVGKVIEIDDEDVHITFMEPYLNENYQYFRWPKSEDNVWVGCNEILCVIPEPCECKRGYTLPEGAKKSALELHSSWRKKWNSEN